MSQLYQIYQTFLKLLNENETEDIFQGFLWMEDPSKRGISIEHSQQILKGKHQQDFKQKIR